MYPQRNYQIINIFVYQIDILPYYLETKHLYKNATTKESDVSYHTHSLHYQFHLYFYKLSVRKSYSGPI